MKKSQKIALIFGGAAVSVAALTGCAVNVHTQDSSSFDAQQVVYDKDIRTGLCFSAVFYENSYGRSRAIGNVECTDQVIALVPPEKRTAEVLGLAEHAPGSNVQQSGANTQADADFDAGKLSYAADLRTGQCFAVTFYENSYGHSRPVTAVPCTEKVVNLLPQNNYTAYIKAYGAPKVG